MNELESIGLSPTVLQRLLQQSQSQSQPEQPEAGTPIPVQNEPDGLPKVVYELSSETAKIEPRLRFFLPASPPKRRTRTTQGHDTSSEGSEPETTANEHDEEQDDEGVSQAVVRAPVSPTSVLYTLQRGMYAANQASQLDAR